ncbi:DsrE family protein [Sphingomonas sabuli]|uniref:DsrE family protein n=1 Tax=Sphingomonas sabuli TaxID=2764186 RepID=A0A7G9L5K9_9SPHN|nr:DsrE family protein [Sphingomonas sabuli]QNM83908.1 DsrE family protein [Sphingomonas sabuli]
MTNPRLAVPALIAAAIGLAAASPAVAAPQDFHAGPAIPAFGKVARVDSDMALPADATWKHSFDVAAGDKGKFNRGLESAARLANMMAEAGVAGDRMRIAIVVHGPAVLDVANARRYAAAYPGAANPNAALVAALVAAGMDVWVCGQSAVGQDVAKADLLPGVKMAVSAMTAHAELQRQGYSINPF